MEVQKDLPGHLLASKIAYLPLPELLPSGMRHIKTIGKEKKRAIWSKQEKLTQTSKIWNNKKERDLKREIIMKKLFQLNHNVQEMPETR